MDRTPIGIVGLGLVGQSLGERLRSAGWPTLGFDLRAEAVDAFRQAGGIAAASVREVGQQLRLRVARSVRHPGRHRHRRIARRPARARASCPHRHRLFDRQPGAAGAARAAAEEPGRGFHRGTAVRLQPADRRRRCHLAASAATATPSHAATRLLDAIATRRIHAGSAGMGAKAKLATNLVLGLNRAALAEGMVFAQALGIAPERFLAMVLATPARSDAAQIKGPLMVRGDFAPQSRIRQHLKDVDLMLDSARSRRPALAAVTGPRRTDARRDRRRRRRPGQRSHHPPVAPRGRHAAVGHP